MRTEITDDNINKLPRKDRVRFALFCAKQVIHLAKEPEAHECIRVTELWLEGKASAEDCRRAVDATHVYYDTTYADDAAAHAAHAAYYATYYEGATAATQTANYAIGADTTIKSKLEQYLYEFIHIDEIVEQILLAI